MLKQSLLKLLETIDEMYDNRQEVLAARAMTYCNAVVKAYAEDIKKELGLENAPITIEVSKEVNIITSKKGEKAYQTAVSNVILEQYKTPQRVFSRKRVEVIIYPVATLLSLQRNFVVVNSLILRVSLLESLCHELKHCQQFLSDQDVYSAVDAFEESSEYYNNNQFEIEAKKYASAYVQKRGGDLIAIRI